MTITPTTRPTAKQPAASLPGAPDRPGLLTARRGWPTTRILFALAGSVTLLSVTLAVTASPWWSLVTAAVGINQLLYVVAGACPASLVVDGLRRRTSLTVAAEEDTCSSTTTR